MRYREVHLAVLPNLLSPFVLTFQSQGIWLGLEKGDTNGTQLRPYASNLGNSKT
jgi:hypothetical protein